MTGALQLAGAGGGISGWPTFISGIAIGALTIFVAVVIAWRQRVIQLRDRAAERTAQDSVRKERIEQEVKVARREMWRADYSAIRDILELCEVLASYVRHEGPLTKAELDVRDIGSLRMKAERLAERDVPGLREPLGLLVGSLDSLVRHAATEDARTAAASPQGAAPDSNRMHAIQRTAVLQDRAERELTGHIAAAWKALRSEWGSWEVP